LLNQALQLAVNMGDKENVVSITSSLAETYIVELHDMAMGKIWLARLEEALDEHWDDIEYEQLISLRKDVESSS
jgi:hypothetical protein